MFWRVSGFTQPSPVEAALDRPNCTLEDLLPEDDLVQVGRWLFLRPLCRLLCRSCIELQQFLNSSFSHISGAALLGK